MPADFNNHQTTTVCLDGSEVKRQRELHGLTQLYISKVVGVTTDTISRWENNRYPTIRRENAINLAEALEVPLEQILRKEPEGAEPQIEPAAKANPRRILIPVLAVGLVLLLGAWFYLGRAPDVPVRVAAFRDLPVFAAPATEIPVQVVLERLPGGGGFILREEFPAGWKLVEAAPAPSSLDNVGGVARWIVKPGDATNRIAYLVRVAASADAGSAAFRGEVVAGTDNGRASVAVSGDRQVEVAPIHWADADGDGRIDDVEMLETSYVVDEMAGVHIDYDRLERLWDAGGYRWHEQEQRFVAVPPESPAEP